MLAYLLCLVAVSMAAEPRAAMMLPELDPPYCAVRYRRLCQGKGRHVACQFPTQGPGESCVNYTLIKFTKELRHFVTHYINRRRQRLASGSERVRGGVHLPRPEVMMQVEWDRELALLAQRLADQCSFVHDDCRATVRFPYAGQTVGEVKWRRTSESDMQNLARAIRRVLDAWWGERRRVTVRQLTQPFRLTNKGNVWGHFSQLSVWTLRAVGCGAVRHGNKYPKILLVCDFSHTNMLGQRTIVPGALSPCPIHTARKQRSPYPSLCAPVRHQEPDGPDFKSNNHPEDMNYYDNNDSSYNEDELENTIFANDTTVEANEYTLPPEVHRARTRKRMRVNPWGETDKPQDITKRTDREDEGNEISFDNDGYEKVKIPKKGSVNEKKEKDLKSKIKEKAPKIKNMQTKTTTREKEEDDTFDESEVEGGDEETGTESGTYQIKRIRDRGKSREKGNVQETIKPAENYVDNDTTDEVIKKVQDKEKSHDKVRSEDSDFDGTSETEKLVTETTRIYKIKRIRDREKDHEGERVQEPETTHEKAPERIDTPERERPSEHEAPPKRKEYAERERLPGRERTTAMEIPPEREYLSVRKGPLSRTRNFDSAITNIAHDRESHLERERERIPERIPDRERIPERVPERERVPDREAPQERERQPERLPERERSQERERLPNRNWSSERERVLERPPGRARPPDFEPSAGPDQLTLTESMREIERITYRYEPTTEKQKPRYMIKIGDIQKQQRNFMDLKNARKGGSNRQKEFYKLQDNPINKLSMELAEENYKESIGTPQFRRPQPAYGSNKYRINDEDESSPKNLLDSLKEVGNTGEPRRTQFYEPVGMRHRWRPTKDRPERPGARALMTNAYLYTTTRPPAPKKNSVTFASITMDKDDVEQLFKDTGFNLGWKQYKKILS